MEVEIKFMALNAAGLLNIVKLNRIAKYLKQQKTDILCMQETHLRQLEAKLLHYICKGDIYHAPSTNRSAGIMIRVRAGISWVSSQSIIDPPGRYIIVKREFGVS